MPPASPLFANVLFVSRDPHLLATRVALLRQQGIEAFPCDVANVARALRNFEFGTLILCNSLHVAEKRVIIARFKFRRRSGLTVSINSDTPEILDADVQMDSPVLPEQWQQVVRILKNRSARTSPTA